MNEGKIINIRNMIVKATSTDYILDENMSKKISEIVKGPKIDIFYTDFYQLNAMTFPLQFDSREEFLSDNSHSIILRSLYNLCTRQNVTDDNYEIINGVAYLKNVKYIPILYDKHFSEYFTEEEIIAILLHEVGHHNLIRKTSLTIINHSIFVITLLAKLILIYLASKSYDYVLPAIIFHIITIVIAYSLSKQLDHELEFGSDDFVKRLGYGKILATSQLKLHKLYPQLIPLKSSKFCDVCRYVIGIISTHPSMYERICRLVDNPDKFIEDAELKNDIVSKKIITFTLKVAEII